MEDVSGGLYMERAIMVGAFGFLGYSVCRAMLDKGIEVNVISIDDESDFFIEEKRMEIGRNANLLEDEAWERTAARVEAPIPVIIPFYDYYMVEKEEVLFENQFIQEELFSLPPENYPITLLLPEQLEYEGSSAIKPLVKLKEKLSNKGFLLKEVLVPTLYGPWQPEECFFQQILSFSEDAVDVPTLNPRESTIDAIYVSDAASVVLGLLEEAQGGKYLIRSGETNGWYKCLKSIYDSLLVSKKIDEEARKWINDDLKNRMKSKSSLEQMQKLGGDYRRVYVKAPLDTLEGLEHQWKQYLRVLRGKQD
jgi:hypothetical protein